MNEVCQTIPHRPPFLFIDEILEANAEKAVARREIRASEPHFQGHYPGNPIMPGVLLCEAVFQTGAVFLIKHLKGKGESIEGRTPVLSRIGSAKFKRMVKPGDTITIEASLKETMGKFHFMAGKVTKEGKTVLAAEFALALV